ncbi:DUF397 domain-containing protein [Streptomyces antibioticus]|uniref:DUF397 domain-containing protein n=1 Tax=Streptomyces antibioticus TaxID=1890 RepID=UPI00225B2FEA|nr:DUF397 domain-containing protein [Streptomyces antibioticus]MCX4738924.1 DUF397 domain-containing protein [Streptomyces antibioticus]
MSDADGGRVWFTSSYSNGAGGECVECALTDDGTLVRDSKASGVPVVAFGSEPWRSFIRSVKHHSSEE